jgi:glycosyltransferase involved in cell wall biosynthesis
MHDQIRALSESNKARYDIRIFVGETDFNDTRIVIAREPSSILRDHHFRQSQLLIFHWGVYYRQFDLIFAVLPDQLSLVYFHNITPAHPVDSEARKLIACGEQQIENLSACDFILCNSAFSMEELVRRGIPRDRLDVLPPAPIIPTCPEMSRATLGPAQLLYVGRFVTQKGVHELLRAVSKARSDGAAPFHLRMAGALRYSDRNYIAEMKSIIESEALDDVVTFLGELSNEALAAEFTRAHALVMPSYHEGFCIPVIEAFNAGCYVISFDGGNLPYLIGDLGTVVQSGDINALGAAVADFANRVARPFAERRYTAKGTELTVTDYEQAARKFSTEHTSFDVFKKRIDGFVEKILRAPNWRAKAGDISLVTREPRSKERQSSAAAATLEQRLTKLEHDFADRRKLALAAKNVIELQQMSPEWLARLYRSRRGKVSRAF